MGGGGGVRGGGGRWPGSPKFGMAIFWSILIRIVPNFQ